MSELSRLIEINENIEKQNTEIIRLLKIIAGEKDIHEEVEIVEDTQLLDVDIGIGEVYFVDDGDIFKLSIKNNEMVIDNLTGSVETDNFNVQELIANESIVRNESLSHATVILGEENSDNLPETLKLCIDQGASNVYIPWSAMSQLIRAPQQLMTLLKLDFYKSTEDLIEKLFTNE